MADFFPGRLVEMMIGVICTCAPFLNRLTQDHASEIKFLTSFVSSHLSFSFLKHSVQNSFFKSSSSFPYERRHESEDDATGVSTSDKEGLTGEKSPGTMKDQTYQFNPMDSSCHTVVAVEEKRSELFDDEDHRIHLKREILQERVMV